MPKKILTHTQFYKLSALVHVERDMISKCTDSWDSLCTRLGDKLGFKVSEYSVREACKIHNIIKPNSRKTHGYNDSTRARIYQLEKVCKRLCKKLGVVWSPSEDLEDAK